MLTNLQKFALENIKAGASRDELAPGVHYVEPFTVEVRGEIKVGTNETFRPTAEIPLIPTVALALKKMGVQREHFMRVMREAVTEVLLQDGDMRQQLIAESGLTDFENEFRQKVLAELPMKTRAGKVKASLEVTPVTTGVVI